MEKKAFGPPPQHPDTSQHSVLHFFVDKDGLETGESERIGLAPDGSADLSTMRDQAQAQTWRDIGIKDVLGLSRVYPEDGVRFLKALLRKNNQLWRFRRSAT